MRGSFSRGSRFGNSPESGRAPLARREPHVAPCYPVSTEAGRFLTWGPRDPKS